VVGARGSVGRGRPEEALDEDERRGHARV